jgi:AraC-like DNA-binding protein
LDLRLPATADGREVFELLGEEMGFSCEVEGAETVVELPEGVGRGRLTNLVLREGLELFAMDCVFAEDFRLEVTSSSSLLEMSFCLSGGGRGTVEGIGEDFVVRPGDCGLFLGVPGTRGSVRYAAGRRIVGVEVRVLPPLLCSVLGCEPEEAACVLGMPGGPETGPRYRPGRTVWEAELALGRMLACPYSGATRRLYLEAKALEVLALGIGTPDGGTERLEEGQTPLRAEDEERIRLAAALLVESMEDPPSLVELARRVALNDHKLKVGFKQVFGTTAFGYLKERRLERARELLATGQMSVGEVSAAVGYANQSRFASAFRLRFGANPREYRLGNKGRRCTETPWSGHALSRVV